MQYYYAYFNKTTKKLGISAIVDNSNDLIQLMYTTDLQSVKIFCIGFIMGSWYGTGGWKIESKVEDFADDTTYINGKKG